MKILFLAARVVAAFIMIQTLWFKFSGAEESVYIFSQVGMEPWGRYGVGIGELLASLFILYPRTVWIGGLVAMGLMAGAIVMHLTKLGVVVFDDGGQLFIYACSVFACGAFVLYHDRDIAKADIARFRGK